MWVKEVIIDGFKSYANRTVISGWDKSFNAITGLNGSGKSNILDSICFVLGISNLTQVRVHNLQELVYKQGQSRVTKASVTIVFDNTDTKSSPVGYEQFEEITVTRQIVIGGKNKYLINGHTAQLSRVQNLFHSVQLNVNNPHFLIMQGRITKVVNMKPLEVLGMIEEAAGTRMYESKKKAAQKTIAKKQSKVEEINKILVEEITPTLEKLRKERTNYMRWSANNTEMERLQRFCVAYNFSEAEKIMNEALEDVNVLEDKVQGFKDENEDIEGEIGQKSDVLQKMNKQKAKEDNRLGELEDQVGEHSKELVQHTSKWTNMQDSHEAEEQTKKKLLRDAEDIKKTIAKKQTKKGKAAEQARLLEEKYKSLQSELEALEGQQLGFGMDEDSKNSKGSLTSQLMDAQRKIAENESAGKQGKKTEASLKKEIASKKKALKKEEKEYNKLVLQKTKKEKELAVVDGQLKALMRDSSDSKMDTSDEEEDVEKRQARLLHRLSKERKELERQVQALEERMERTSSRHQQCEARLARFRFDFSSPSKNFDRSKVKGLVAKLFTVSDSKTSTAIEVTAGGRLYNVIVDSEHTGKELLNKGRLKRRITLIPLDKIRARNVIDAAKLKRAQELVGKDNVHTAMSLVCYDDELEEAMKYIFGGAFICKNGRIASKVTFDPKIRTKSVTLDGDVFDPAGTLTGGSRKSNGSILDKLSECSLLKQELTSMQAAMQKLRGQLQGLVQRQGRIEELLEQKDLLAHSLSLLQERIDQTSFAQIQKDITAAEERLGTVSAEVKEGAVQLKELGESVKKIENFIRDFEKERKKQQKQLETQMKTVKKQVSQAAAAMKKGQQQLSEMAIEEEELSAEIDSLLKQAEDMEGKLKQSADKVDALGEVVAEKRAQYTQAKQQLDDEKAKLAQCDAEINAVAKERTALTKKMNENALQIKKLSHKIKQMVTDQSDAKRRVEGMLSKHEWIHHERNLFGQEGGDYDFEEESPKHVQSRLNTIKEQQAELSKKINKKVMGMFEKAENEYQDLLHKKDIIQKDKSKIEEVIDELDRKKNEVLQSTWAKVTKDFGSIFGTLLPGTDAKLEPLEGCSVLDGLEVKVAFGGVWKQSLSELSGGQRSLLALSLILALLLFKPAPMYILDEIDAALDLSHTQNIGAMLKQHFSQSQFIVVSLKEGMFNNANVLFRTKFVDGVSTVNRTAHVSALSSSSMNNKVLGDVTNKSNNTSKNKGKAKRRTRR